MNNRFNSLAIALIFIVPVALYLLLSVNTKSESYASTTQPTVIDFYAPLCSECQELKKNMDIVEPKYSSKVKFIRIDVTKTDSGSLVKKYKVSVVPTLVFLNKNNKVLKQTTGNMCQKDLEKNIERILHE